MRFVNLNNWPLDFQIDGHPYKVPVGEECEIPDAIAYVVKERGLKLTPASEVEPAPPPMLENPPPPEPTPVRPRRR